MCTYTCAYVNISVYTHNMHTDTPLIMLGTPLYSAMFWQICVNKLWPRGSKNPIFDFSRSKSHTLNNFGHESLNIGYLDPLGGIKQPPKVRGSDCAKLCKADLRDERRCQEIPNRRVQTTSNMRVFGASVSGIVAMVLGDTLCLGTRTLWKKLRDLAQGGVCCGPISLIRALYLEPAS